MTTLYAVNHDHDGVAIFSKLPADEAAVVGDVSLMVHPCEEALGLSYAKWLAIALGSGRIESDILPGND